MAVLARLSPQPWGQRLCGRARLGHRAAVWTQRIIHTWPCGADHSPNCPLLNLCNGPVHGHVSSKRGTLFTLHSTMHRKTARPRQYTICLNTNAAPKEPSRKLDKSFRITFISRLDNVLQIIQIIQASSHPSLTSLH